MNQEISLLILIETKKGQRQKQIDAFNKLAPIVLIENGCLQYELKEVEDSENNFVLMEKWSSKKDLEAHDITPHMIEADKLSSTFRARPVTVLIMKDITKTA
jgi:quinol monooxygenase YgiN